MEIYFICHSFTCYQHSGSFLDLVNVIAYIFTGPKDTEPYGRIFFMLVYVIIHYRYRRLKVSIVSGTIRSYITTNLPILVETKYETFERHPEKSNRKAMNRNWSNQKANPVLKTKTGNAFVEYVCPLC